MGRRRRQRHKINYGDGGGSGGGGDISRLDEASAGDDDPAFAKTPSNYDMESVEELQESQQATGAQQVRTVV